MKPWLYRLADEDNTAVQAVFGGAARQRAVEAVLTASRMTDKMGASDYPLLHSTLAAVWGGASSGDVGAAVGLSDPVSDPPAPSVPGHSLPCGPECRRSALFNGAQCLGCGPGA